MTHRTGPSINPTRISALPLVRSIKCASSSLTRSRKFIYHRSFALIGTRSIASPSEGLSGHSLPASCAPESHRAIERVNSGDMKMCTIYDEIRCSPSDRVRREKKERRRWGIGWSPGTSGPPPEGLIPGHSLALVLDRLPAAHKNPNESRKTAFGPIHEPEGSFQALLKTGYSLPHSCRECFMKNLELLEIVWITCGLLLFLFPRQMRWPRCCSCTVGIRIRAASNRPTWPGTAMW